jgi:heme ABC exporter ATP-binding subunit CcmA
LPADLAPADAAPCIALTRVSQLFGQFAALRDVSLTIAAGASVVLLGENGAGKSTLLRLLAGLSSPSYGSITVFGERPLDVRHRIAYMSHAPMLYDELTARENLDYFRALYAETNTLTSGDAALQAVGLDPANTRRVGTYSQGMRQRTALARTLMTQPDLLLLDEPFSNLDAASAESMIARLHDFLAEPGSGNCARTLVLTTHQVELARPLATTLLTLRSGMLLSQIETNAVPA